MKRDEYKINGKIIAVEKLNFSELIDIIFLIIPYLKLIKRIRAEYLAESSGEIFRFVIQTLADEIDREDLYKVFSIALRLPEEEIKTAEISELVLIIPQIIRRNGLLDLYLLMKRLGALDG